MPHQLWPVSYTHLDVYKRQDIVFDYSKNRITSETMSLLTALATECRLPEAIQAMFNGDQINATENRAVLHTGLRNFSGNPVFTQGQDVMPGIKKVLRKMKGFCEQIHSGKHRGYTNKKIRYIVNLSLIHI